MICWLSLSQVEQTELVTGRRNRNPGLPVSVAAAMKPKAVVKEYQGATRHSDTYLLS